MTTMPSNLTQREQTRLVLHERMKQKIQRVEGGPWDGVPVVTEKDLDIAFGEVLPAPSLRAADVTTPARVIVHAVCPNCHVPQQIALMISPKLEIDDEHKTLKLVAKAKSMGHTCGQQPLPLPVEGQTEAFEEDVAVEAGADDAELGEPEDGRTVDDLAADVANLPLEQQAVVADAVHELAKERRSSRARRARADDVDLGACPSPNCGLAAEHPGPHATADADPSDPDSALLPE